MQRVVDIPSKDTSEPERDLIGRAQGLGRGLLRQNAVAVDHGTLPVRDNLAELSRHGLTGITAPRPYGAGVSRAVEYRVLEALAYGDGTTPFVIAQHYGACSMIAHSGNTGLRERVLPPMARGELLAGFGISQVRRAGPPALAAAPLADGYRFDGTIPWMTGFGVFSHVVIAGTLSDGRRVLAWTPFNDSPRMRIRAPMELIAMNAALTVSAACAGLTVAGADVVAVEPPTSRTRANMTTVPCLFGLAQVSIDDLSSVAARRNAPSSGRAAVRLQQRLDAARRFFYDAVVPLDESEPETPLAEARAEATRVALDATAALIVATGGGANARTHPAQRRLREASVFATWGLSPEAVDVAVTALVARD